MNTAIWTLWMIAIGIGNGGEPPNVVPMATFSTQEQCLQSIQSMYTGLHATYGKDAVGPPGLMICVPGDLVKR